MGDLIILCLDANEAVRPGDILRFTRQWNLLDAHYTTHPLLPPAPTCSKSTDLPIDGIWCSRALHIEAAGYAGFDDAPLFHTDHRFLWVDISLQTALQHPAPILPYHPPSRLSILSIQGSSNGTTALYVLNMTATTSLPSYLRSRIGSMPLNQWMKIIWKL